MCTSAMRVRKALVESPFLWTSRVDLMSESGRETQEHGRTLIVSSVNDVC